MVWRFFQVLMVTGITVAAFVVAQQYLLKPNLQCYDIVNSGDRAPWASVLINKCAGNSWLLVRVPLNEKDKSFTYQWQAIQSVNYGDPTLVSNSDGN